MDLDGYMPMSHHASHNPYLRGSSLLTHKYADERRVGGVSHIHSSHRQWREALQTVFRLASFELFGQACIPLARCEAARRCCAANSQPGSSAISRGFRRGVRLPLRGCVRKGRYKRDSHGERQTSTARRPFTQLEVISRPFQNVPGLSRVTGSRSSPTIPPAPHEPQTADAA